MRVLAKATKFENYYHIETYLIGPRETCFSQRFVQKNVVLVNIARLKIVFYAFFAEWG